MPTSTSRRPVAQTGIPGGDYTARENPDGSWDILEVEVLGPLEAGVRRNRNPIGRGWFWAAIGTARRRLAEGYLAPFHVYHHEDTKRAIRAGFFLLTTVGRITYEGKPTDVVFADIKAVPPKVFELIDRGELPYRSVEVHDWESPEINSLAALPTEVPYFRFPLLTIGQKIYASDREAAQFFALEPGTPAVAVFRLEETPAMIKKIDPRTGKVVTLSDEEAEELDKAENIAEEEIEELEDDDEEESGDLQGGPPQPEEEEEAPAAPSPEAPAEGEAPPVEAVQEEAPPAWTAPIVQGLQALNQGMSQILELLGGGQQTPPVEETAPAPAAFQLDDDEEIPTLDELSKKREKDTERWDLFGSFQEIVDRIARDGHLSKEEKRSRLESLIDELKMRIPGTIDGFRALVISAKKAASDEEPTKGEAGKAGEVAALRAKERQRDAKDAILTLVTGTIDGLAAKGYEVDEETRGDITRFAAVEDQALLESFVSAFERNSVQDPPPTLEALEHTIGTKSTPEVEAYRGKSPEIFKLAQEAGAAFDDLGKRVGKMPKSRFIELEIARAVGS